MLGVKLTVLSSFITIALEFIVWFGVNVFASKETMWHLFLKTGLVPRWLDILGSIIGLFLVLDIIGVLWCVMYLLILR